MTDESPAVEETVPQRSTSLMLRIFLSMLGVSLLSVFGVGMIVRTAFQRAFGFYLEHQPMMGGPRSGTVGMMLGATEQEFQRSVDNGILLAALIAVVSSAIVAFLVARALTRSLDRLTVAVGAVAEGDLEHRVEVQGPAEVERLGEAFNEMASSLSEAETLRRRMVADVAHELRNPVASLRAQAEGMAEGVLAADGERVASLVEDVAHLSRLVDDLQELSMAEAGRLSYDKVRLDLRDVVEREVERYAVQATESVAVRSACAAGDASVFADPARVGQVLRNLLSNALRHTARGEVTVGCAREGAEVLVRVSDTGEGIPEADLPYVFERFYRADAARTRDTGGAGVGLAISRRIVEDHGGRVFVESEEGRGATVGFALPAASEKS